MFLYMVAASVIGSLVSLVGGFLLLWNERFAKKVSLILVGFAAGSLMGAAFLELFPEALAEIDYGPAAVALIAGILLIFLFEKGIKLYHHHDHEEHEHTFASTVLAGDAIHNFIDGIVIAFGFSAGPVVGATTTLAVFLHEIPQEIGDFGVLLHAGWKRSKILFFNIITALTTVVGAMLGYFLLPWIEGYVPLFLAFAAGTFIYISVSDLLPELRHKTKATDFVYLISIVLGIAVIWILGTYLPE